MRQVAGGDKLARRLAELAKKVTKKATLRVGFLEGATYPDGTSVAMVAAIQEFGAPKVGIPPRPFFRNMIAAKAESWGDGVAAQLARNGYDAEVTLKLAGAGIKGQLQQSIKDIGAPPLSPVTLMLRKMRSQNPALEVTGATVGEAARRVAAGESTSGVSTKALIDSGHLWNSVDYEVES